MTRFRATKQRPLRVMQSFGAPAPTTNPYISMLDEALAATGGMIHMRFTWRTALFGRYDAFHWHWPEARMHGSNWAKSAVKIALTGLLAVRHALSRKIAVVRTVHNVELPDDTPTRLRILRFIDANTDFRIVLNPTTSLPEGTPHRLILHGDYRAWYARYPRRERVPGRLGAFGGVRRYKGVDAMVGAYASAVRAEPSLGLVVGGNPSSVELADSLRGWSRELSKLELRLHFLTDAELVELVSSVELVVLAYRFMHNSGSVLASLSLGRPVLVPRNEVNEALAEEVGPAWVQMYEGELDGDQLVAAWRNAHDVSGSPNLSLRSWESAGVAHLAAFRQAVKLKRRRTHQGGVTVADTSAR